MKFFLPVILCFFLAKKTIAQVDTLKKHKIDSLTKKLTKDSLHTFRFKKYRPFGNIDNRNSFIRDKPVNFTGFQLGVIYKEYHTFGLGFYKMTEQSQKPRAAKDGNHTITESLTLNYSTFFYQYVLVDKRFYEIDLPFEIGLGRYNLRYQDSLTKQVYKDFTAPIVPLGAGMQFIFKPVRWIGVSVTGGYRYVAKKNVNINFNGFYYSYGVWVDLRQIYRDIKYYGFQKKHYRREVNAILLN